MKDLKVIRPDLFLEEEDLQHSQASEQDSEVSSEDSPIEDLSTKQIDREDIKTTA